MNDLADDRGAGAVWVLCCCALLLVVATVAIVRTSAVLARHRAESAADLAALAGALGIGTGTDPCGAARANARRNDAVLRGCVLQLDASGRSGTVLVHVSVPADLPVVGHRSVGARARAGRSAS